jgi:hypothetical protein
MPQYKFPHLTLKTHADKVELLTRFLEQDQEKLLTFLYSVMSETQWDRVKEEQFESLILYGNGGEGKSKCIYEALNASDNVHVIVQYEMRGPFCAFTFGAPSHHRYIFERQNQKEAFELEEQIQTLVIRFEADPAHTS